MTWVRLEDKFHLNPKIAEVGNAPAGLYVRFLSYCADQLTDGFIPVAIARLYGKKSEVSALVTAKLILPVDKGFQIPDYLQYNPTRTEVETEQRNKHQAKVDAGRAGGYASGIARRKQTTKQTGSTPEANGEANGKQNEAPTRPDPLLVKGIDDRDLVTRGASSSSHSSDRYIRQTCDEYADLIAARPENTTRPQSWRDGVSRNCYRERYETIYEGLCRAISPTLIAQKLAGTEPPPARPEIEFYKPLDPVPQLTRAQRDALLAQGKAEARRLTIVEDETA